MSVQIINSELVLRERCESPGMTCAESAQEVSSLGEIEETLPAQSEVTLKLRSRRNMLRRMLFPVTTVVGGNVAGFAAAEPNEVPADIDPGALITKLVKRTTQGATPSEISLASSLGYYGYLEHQLAPELIDDSVLGAKLLAYPRLTMTFADLYQANEHYYVMRDLASVKVLRSIYSRRQLFERMVEFWTDHFNMDVNLAFGGYFKVVDDREVIRPNALGNFPDFLRAIVISPSMLAYLTNTLNSAGHPNENFAREMLELHTMGVGSGYTQNDVQEVARCFTGWTITPTNLPGTGGLFHFNAKDHDDNDKMVLGTLIPGGGGMQDVYTVVNILSEHPATARFIATKLCKWFLQEQPTASVIDSVAATYTRTRGDIKAMIRTILTPNALYAAAPKYKRPFHLVTSGFRLLESEISDTYFILFALEHAGHMPYQWGSPDGYPDRVTYWGGNHIARWNFCTALGENQLLGIQTDASRLFIGLTTADEVVNRISRDVFQGEMNLNDWTLARDFLAVDPLNPVRRGATVGLVMSMQGFQWY